MAELERIAHSIPPTYDEHSRVLMLGSLPSPKSRETGYNYGHPQNRFWKVMATLAGEPIPTTNERKRDFCLRHHIALWDVVGECQIEGASDASIRDAKPNPLWEITQAAPIEAIFCTGAKAHELYGKLCEERVGMPAVKLPSTSPANAACSMDQLLEAYAQVFEHTHEFEPPCLDVPDVVALEQAIAASGTPLSELMDRAGTALARYVDVFLRDLEAGTYPRTLATTESAPLIVLLCGSGNNGGDGWVAAQLLAQRGHRVCLVTKRAADDITAQPAHNAAIRSAEALSALGAVTLANGTEGDLDQSPLILVNPSSEQIDAVMNRAVVVVDAILGTGASGRSPKEPFASWITAANAARSHAVVVACDAPSGISAQDGQTVEPHIIADETVTMIVRKPGLAAPESGTVHVAPLAYIEPHLEAGI